MRRSDRLFDLIQILRDGRLHRATEIASALQVSVRTIWRDMSTLIASGMPIEGERGVGYVLRTPLTLPPLMLNTGELDALRLGLKLVAAGQDATLARAARALAAKIATAVPAPITEDADDPLAFRGTEPSRAAPHLPMLRAAIRDRQVLTLLYLEPLGAEGHSDVRPLQLDLRHKVWTLIAWCDRRGNFRSYRVDRIVSLTATGQTFAPERGKRLRDYKTQLADAASVGRKDKAAVAADHQP